MSEIGIRIAVIVVILMAVVVAAWSAGRTRRARPLHTTRDDLPPGVHLFTSSTCATCTEARRVIASTYGDAFTETRHEDDPESFGHHGITRVPTAVVVFADGRAMVFEGVPRRRHLPAPPAATPASR